MKILNIIVIIFFLSLAPALGEKTPEFKDILELKTPGNPLISPNGEYILYSISQPDWDKNKYVSQIHMAVVKTGETKQMTFAKTSSSSYAWSPDSRYFTFKSDRGDKTQLYMMSVSGGEGKQISDFKEGFSAYRWSPDGKHIAYTAKDEKSKRDKAIEKKYGGFKIIDKEAKPAHLLLLTVETRKTEKIVDRKDLHVTSFNWSPDGKKIVFSANPDSRILSFSKSDIYVVNLSDKKVSKLVEQKGPDSSPVWSPDGKTIAFVSSMGEESYFVNSELCTIPAAGGPITCLSRDFDENIGLRAWKKDGIYFLAFQGMTRHLYRLNPRNRAVRNLTEGRRWMLWGFSLTNDVNAAAFTM
jgi:Tol biopolymer transport system component